MKAKVDAFSDDVKQYGFGPSGYDDYEKERNNIIYRQRTSKHGNRS